jgi:hypothetical protein
MGKAKLTAGLFPIVSMFLFGMLFNTMSRLAFPAIEHPQGQSKGHPRQTLSAITPYSCAQAHWARILNVASSRLALHAEPTSCPWPTRRRHYGS